MSSISGFDLIVSRLPIEPRTALLLNFSDPYNQNAFTVVAHRKRADGMRTRDAFDRPSVRLGVRRGSVGADVAARVFPRADREEFDDEHALHAALVGGRLHGVVLGSPAPEFLALRHAGTLVVPLAEPLAHRSPTATSSARDADRASGQPRQCPLGATRP